MVFKMSLSTSRIDRATSGGHFTCEFDRTFHILTTGLTTAH
jgi:hypothetical protein